MGREWKWITSFLPSTHPCLRFPITSCQNSQTGSESEAEGMGPVICKEVSLDSIPTTFKSLLKLF